MHDNFDHISSDSKVEYIQTHLTKPIVLVGLMGVGKTRIGKKLATTLNIPFYDSDDEITEAARMTIPEIFEKYGETYFRDGEHRVIKRLLSTDSSAVIATGGGAVMTQASADLIWSQSLSVWIRASLDTMVERTSRNNNRPLLAGGDSRQILQSLIDQRYSTYEKATFTVDSDSNQTQKVIHEIINLIYTDIVD